MSDEAKLRTAAGLSAAWDGEPIKRVRGGDGVLVLPGRRLAMHLMAQPEVASGWLNDPLLRDQGMLSRILATAPDAASGTRLWQEPTPESDAAMKRYGARLLTILERPFPLAPGSKNELAPRSLTLAQPARRAWIAFVNHVERGMAPNGALDAVRELANKLPEHAARIAATLALVRDVDAAEVSGGDLAAGIELAQHYAAEALRLFAVGQINERLSLAQRLLAWLHGSWTEPTVSLPEIYRLGPNAIRTKEVAAAMVGVSRSTDGSPVSRAVP